MNQMAVALTVLLLCGIVAGCARNAPPVISAGNLIQAPEDGQGGGLVRINVDLEVIASDPDGDALQYSWSVPTGTIVGSGSKVRWQGWNADATAVATVSDGRGGEATWKFELQ